MTQSWKFVSVPVLLLIFLVSAGLAAQETGPRVLPEDAEGVADDSKTGWSPGLLANGTFSLGQSANVPGAPDGVSMSLGYMIGGRLDYLSPSMRHEWTNALNLELGFTRTPAIDVFIKSLDRIDFKTSYLYHFAKVPWLGPFASLRLSTVMLRTVEVRADPVNVIRLDLNEDYTDDGAGNLTLDGLPADATHPRANARDGRDKIRLTPPFSPLTLRESAGIFALPLDKTEVKLDIRLGVGAWETFVNGGYALSDNDATADLLELRAMEDTVQLGAELAMLAGGILKERVLWGLSALFMQPFVHNSDTTLEGIDLLNMEFEASLGVSLWEFLSVNYAFKAYRQPLIVDDWQIQNSLLISVGINLPRPAPTPMEEPAACECPACDAPAAEEPAPADEPAAEAPPAAEEPVAEEPTPEATTADAAVPVADATAETPAAPAPEAAPAPVQ